MSVGHAWIKKMSFEAGSGQLLTVGAGSVTVTQSNHTVDESGGDQTINTLVGGNQGDYLMLRNATGANLVILTNAGNIDNAFGINLVLSLTTDYVLLLKANATEWAVVGWQISDDVNLATPLVSDVFTVTRAIHTVGGEGGMTDDLVTINGGSNGQKIKVLRGADNIAVLNSGNIVTFMGIDFVLSTAGDWFEATYDGATTQWVVTATNIAAEVNAVTALATDAFTVLRAVHTVGGEGAMDDDLATISGGANGQKIKVLRGADNIAVLNSGNIVTFMGIDFVLSTAGDWFEATYDGATTQWVVTATCLAAETNVVTDLNTAVTFIVTQAIHTLTDTAGAGVLSAMTGGSNGQLVKVLCGGGNDIVVTNSATLVTPLGVDFTLAAAGDWFEAVYDVANTQWVVTATYLAAETNVASVLAGDAFAVTVLQHTVSGQGAALDDLATMSGGVNGQTVRVLRGADDITITQAGNIITPLGVNFVMTTAGDWFEATYDGGTAKWVVTATCLADETNFATNLAGAVTFVATQAIHTLTDTAGAGVLSAMTGGVNGQTVKVLHGGGNVIVVTNSATLVTPLGVDFTLAAAGDWFEAVYDVANTQWVVTATYLAAETNVAIDLNGAVTFVATQAIHTLTDTAGAGVLSAMTGGSNGQLVKVLCGGGNDIVVTNSAALVTPLGVDFTLAAAGDWFEAVYDVANTQWVVTATYLAAETNVVTDLNTAVTFAVTQAIHTLSDTAGVGVLSDMSGGANGQTVKVVQSGANLIVVTNSATLVTPLGVNFTLEANSGDWFEATYDGANTRWVVTAVFIGAETNVASTLAGDAFAVTVLQHTVGGQGPAADDLATMSGGVNGQTVRVLRGADDITVTQAGNIVTPLGVNFVLATAGDWFEATYDGGTNKWVVTSTCLAIETVAISAVAAGAFAVTHLIHGVNGGGGPQALTNMTGGVNGQLVKVILTADSITVTESATLGIPMGVDFVLAAPGDYFEAMYDLNGTRWVVTSVNLAANADVRQEVTNPASTITASHANISVDGFGGATDQLDNILGGASGQTVRLTPDDPAGAPITIAALQTGAGEIHTPDGQNLLMAAAEDWVDLYCDGTDWIVTGYNLAVTLGAVVTNPVTYRMAYTRLTHADLTVTGGLTETENIALLPINCHVINAWVDVRIVAGFSVGTTSTLTASIGIAGALTAIRGVANLHGGAARRTYGVGWGAAFDNDPTAALQVQAEFTAGGTMPDIDEVNAGTWDFIVLYGIVAPVA